MGSELGYSPKQATGISGAVLNTCGNLGAITMPIAIGFLVNKAGSIESALFDRHAGLRCTAIWIWRLSPR